MCDCGGHAVWVHVLGAWWGGGGQTVAGSLVRLREAGRRLTPKGLQPLQRPPRAGRRPHDL